MIDETMKMEIGDGERREDQMEEGEGGGRRRRPELNVPCVQLLFRWKEARLLDEQEVKKCSTQSQMEDVR
jgi:hypothetical protein